MRVGGLGEVKRWVLSFGAGAELLEPPELKAALTRDVERLYCTYCATPIAEGWDKGCKT